MNEDRFVDIITARYGQCTLEYRDSSDGHKNIIAEHGTWLQLVGRLIGDRYIVL